LGQIYQNFIDTSVLYGKVIISEKYLPDEEKTIKPITIGGIAGGQKYCIQGILFKFSIDNHGIFNSDHNCQKLASHELKGLINIYNHGSKLGLYIPMMAVILYKGFTLTAICL